jgi:hypothetical protein
MGEENKQTTTEPVTEPVIENKQEPVNLPADPPVVLTTELPKGDGKPADIIELLKSVDSSVLVKSEVVQSLIENARKQEKDKLYKTIGQKDDTNKQLSDTILDLQNQLKLKGEATMEGEKLLLAQLQEMKEAQDRLIKEMEDEKEKTRLAELKSYRDKVVASAKGEIVEALVRGNSVEEIDASAEMAKAEYQKLVAPLKQQVEELGKPNPANAPAPSNPSTPPTLELSSKDLKGLSLDDYAKQREQILGSLKG